MSGNVRSSADHQLCKEKTQARRALHKPAKKEAKVMQTATMKRRALKPKRSRVPPQHY